MARPNVKELAVVAAWRKNPDTTVLELAREAECTPAYVRSVLYRRNITLKRRSPNKKTVAPLKKKISIIDGRAYLV